MTLLPYVLGVLFMVTARVIQLHERRTQAEKLRARDELWRKRIQDVRRSLHDQWAVEEEKWKAKVEGQQELLNALTHQLMEVVNKAGDSNKTVIKEVADMLVRVTQGDWSGQQVPQLNLVDDIAAEAGDVDKDTIPFPEHELENIEWGKLMYGNTGSMVDQEEGQMLGD